jgi:Glycosyl transferase family group 2
MSSSLPAILQRLPALSHLLILIIAVYGPRHFPFIFATVFFGIHAVLSINNLFSIWGQFCAWRGVEATCFPKVYKRHDIEHVIIIPAYKEDIEILRETLDILGSHIRTRDQYHICLAMECREVGSEPKAIQLKMEYQETFGSIDYTMHPVIIGEAPGKSSNVNWAARYMAAKFDAKEHARQVITVIDSDSCLAQDYFQMVAERFMASPPAIRSEMMFCVPIIFDRNAHEVPVFVRIVDILWAQAGLSTTYPTSDIKIPTSVYGLSMQLANTIGFWDTGPEAIGEDMHMFVKCFLSTGGNLHVETIYSPASQLNVVGSRHNEGGIVGWVSDMCARYSQGMRHVSY